MRWFLFLERVFLQISSMSFGIYQLHELCVLCLCQHNDLSCVTYSTPFKDIMNENKESRGLPCQTLFLGPSLRGLPEYLFLERISLCLLLNVSWQICSYWEYSKFQQVISKRGAELSSVELGR